MDFAILGPLRAAGRDGPVTLRAPKHRALLAALLLARREDAVRPERLIDALWGEDPPATAGKALQVYMSELRRVLGPEQPIVTLPAGYGIRLQARQLDLDRFETALADARAARAGGRPDTAARRLREALALFRGEPLSDVPLHGAVAAEAAGLADLRLVALEERIDADLAGGDGAALVGELEALAAEHPYRERLHAQLMLALYRSGRQADALAAFHRARRALVDDLGLEPGRELKRVEAAILAQDRALDAAPPARPTPAPRARPVLAGTAAPATPLLGREAELAVGTALLEDPAVRVLTLTGPGGIGKTRLAMELATRLAPTFGDGAPFVALAAVADEAGVVPAVAQALGLEGDGARSADAVADALRDRSLLLVIDNFEQVVGAAPELGPLLGASRESKLLVTSRAALRIAGEHELQVPPLAVEPAVALFEARARALGQRATPAAGDRERIEQICARLDGLPLAIELAAARTKVLSPQAILERLEHRLDLLSAGGRDAPARQQTLRAAIAWSVDLLDDALRRLFARLAVFAGGWTVAAAEAVCGDDALDGLAGLVDHSLVTRSGERLGMLETVREYALELLEDDPDAAGVRLRHAHEFLALAEEAERRLKGPGHVAWQTRLDADHANLGAAVAYAASEGDAETALKLCGALWRYWLTRGYLAEGRELVAAALAMEGGSAVARLEALNAAGILAGEEGDRATARERFLESLGLAQEAGDTPRAARTGANLGTLALYDGDHAEAARRYEAALSDARSGADDWAISLLLHNLASAREGLGERGRAIELVRESVEIARRVGDPAHLSSTLRTLARMLLAEHSESPDVAELLRESLTISRDVDERPGIVECLETLGAIAGRRGDAPTGAALIGAAETIRRDAGAARHPDDSSWVLAEVDALRAALGDDGYEAALERGRALSAGEAVESALALLGT